MSRVRIHTATEGPRHDPYEYVRVTVTRPNGTQVTFHSGALSGVWCEVRHPDGTRDRSDNPERAAAMFARYAGVTVRAAERAFREMQERPYRFHACNARHLKGVEGYPGEHFIMCGKCGDVLEVQFSVSEVA